MTSLKVPEASVTTKTSNPSARVESVGKATQTSMTTPATISCFLPVALSKALICPGRAIEGD